MDTAVNVEPFKLKLPGDLTFEPEYSVPVSPNFTAHVYRQDKTDTCWDNGALYEETTEKLFVVAYRNDTGEPIDDFTNGRWVDSEFEAMIEIRRLAREIRTAEETEARRASEEANLF